MKRIYFLLATIAVFLMAGCSNEEVIGPEPPVTDGETIFFSIGVSSSSTTSPLRADANALEGEDVIKNLTVLLFKASEQDNGAYVVGKRVSTDTGNLNFIGDLEVAPGDYDIILIANSTIDYTVADNKPATLADLNTKVDNITTQNQSNLLMVSELYDDIELAYMADASTTTGIARRTYCYMFNDESVSVASFLQSQNSTLSTTVYTGDSKKPVVLTRLASRIQLESIAVNFTENLAGCSFQLDSVYLVNLRKGTKLLPSGTSYEAIPAIAPGATSLLYYRGGPASFRIIDKYIAPDAVCEVLAGKGLKIFANTEITSKLENEDETPLFTDYAFENHNVWSADAWEENEYEARLVISGKILYPVGDEETVSFERSYYHIPIKGADFQLVRNKIYAINVTITGYGSNEPDGPSGNNVAIVPVITVADWKIIRQVETD